MAFGSNEQVSLDNNIVRRTGVKFSVEPLCYDMIVFILSFVFGDSRELPAIERSYIKILMNFRRGWDLTNYEKNCLGPCGSRLRDFSWRRIGDMEEEQRIEFRTAPNGDDDV